MAKERERSGREDDRAVYIISVAAEIAGVHPQTLRFYERKGLLSPKRTAGNTRRYSERDIERLQMIQDLTQARGVNLAGVKMIIEMQAELESLRRAIDEMERRLRASRRATREVPARREPSVEILPLRSVFLPPWEMRAGG